MLPAACCTHRPAIVDAGCSGKQGEQKLAELRCVKAAVLQCLSADGGQYAQTTATDRYRGGKEAESQYVISIKFFETKEWIVTSIAFLFAYDKQGVGQKAQLVKQLSQPTHEICLRAMSK